MRMVPFLNVDSQAIVPPWPRIAPCAMGSPRPVPCPTAFVLSPNPPMDRDGRCEESGRGRGRYRRDDRGLKLGRREVGGRSAGTYGGSDGGLEWLWEREGGIGHGKRRSGTGLARVSGDVGLAGGSVADGRRQAGRGMARSRARARLNCSFQGQRWGRWRVNRRAERVIRPAEAKTGRLRVLVVTIC